MISFTEAREKFNHYLKKKNRSKHTLLAYLKDIEQLASHLVSLGRNLVHEVKKEDIEAFLSNLKNSGYTSKSISRKINSTKTFFKFLYEEKVIESDPSKFITHPKLTAKQPRILSALEFKALRDTLKDDIRTAAIFETFLQTGLRISELSELKVEGVTFNEDGKTGVLVVVAEKNYASRSIPLNESVVRALKKYFEIRPKVKTPHLFVTKTGKPLIIRNIRSMMERYFKKTGIENAKVNDLRHTFIAHHLKQGASLYYISKIAGHKRISTTEKYLEFAGNGEKVEKMELGEL